MLCPRPILLAGVTMAGFFGKGRPRRSAPRHRQRKLNLCCAHSQRPLALAHNDRHLWKRLRELLAAGRPESEQTNVPDNQRIRLQHAADRRSEQAEDSKPACFGLLLCLFLLSSYCSCSFRILFCFVSFLQRTNACL